jgi:2-polyprenyl-3-methyl-5-hydroxy-6-metoxy-1,4-benzoquinol methylase
MQASSAPTSTAARYEAPDPAYLAWKDWAYEDFGRFHALDAAYFAAEVPLVPKARVLELGFGNGGFLAWALEAGAETFGIEANPQLVARAQALLDDSRIFTTIHAAELDAHRGSFDHIVAFDVLEHIPQVEYPGLFRRFAELLVPGGRCTLRFPNGDSPFGRAAQHGDPTHVTTIGSELLVYFASDAGLKVQAVRAPKLPTRKVGLRRALRRRFVLLLRFLVESVVGHAYFGRRVPLDQNSLAVITRER